MAEGNQRRIMVLNDDNAVLDLFSELLGEEGYVVSTDKHINMDLEPILEFDPHCIILDFMWANEDSGWAFLQMLRMHPETAKVPIILCTGAVRHVEEVEARLEELSVSVVLKPFDIDELLGTLKAALEGDATAASA